MVEQVGREPVAHPVDDRLITLRTANPELFGNGSCASMVRLIRRRVPPSTSSSWYQPSTPTAPLVSGGITRYHDGMAMTLRLTDEQTQALRETAEREHRSMQEVAVEAVVLYTSRRTRKRDELIASILTDRADVLDRLGKA